MTRKTITYKGLSIRDPAPYGEAGLAWQENFVTIADTLDSLQGSLDTALGGLVIGVDIQAYSANLDTWSSIAPSADAQALASAADYAAMRGLLGLEPGTDIQAHSANLDTWSSIAPSADGQSLVAAMDYAAIRDLLDLEVGKDVQAHSANLDTWSSVAPSANGKSLVAAADYDAMRGLLDLVVGVDIQAYSANLDVWSGVAPSADGQSLVAAEDYAAMRGLLGFTAPILDRTAPGDIGATTPGAGTFTTLSATGTIDTPETTSSTIGVVDIGGLLIHGFRHPTGDTARPDGNNVFIGKLAGNFTMGAEATSTAHASGNTGIGYLVLSRLTTGYDNVAIGDRALRAVTEGTENTAIGRVALLGLTTGSRNVGLGAFAGRYTTGYGENQTTSNSIYIGVRTTASSDGVTNETVIGYNVTGRGSNTVQIGNDSVTDTYLSGWLNLQSDTRGIKLDASGTTTLVSNGTLATLSKPLKTAGYQAADGSAGISTTIAIKDANDVTHTLVFKDGLLISDTTP